MLTFWLLFGSKTDDKVDLEQHAGGEVHCPHRKYEHIILSVLSISVYVSVGSWYFVGLKIFEMFNFVQT